MYAYTHTRARVWIRSITAPPPTHTQAIANHLRDWVHGTAPGEFVSMGVHTAADNPYGVPADIFFSFPVTCQVRFGWIC